MLFARSRLQLFLFLSQLLVSFAAENNTTDAPSVGTAIFLKKSVDRDGDVGNAAVLRDLYSSADYRRMKFAETKLFSRATVFHPTVFDRPVRTLKGDGGCSEHSNGIEAIVACSNAVRRDPDYFAHEYPCAYDSWRGEVTGKKLPSLQTGSLIQRVAQLHTDDQARMNQMSHVGSDGSNLQTRVDRQSMSWGALGENVAVGFSNAKAVVMAWMCSPAHRKNLMSCDFSKIGVGASVSPAGRNYYTQVFSCDLSEHCGCDAGSAPVMPSNPVKARVRREPSEKEDVKELNPCAWIESVWTCGRGVHPQQDDPYDIVSRDQY